MKDDGFGLRVAQALKEKELGENISVQESAEMDLTVIESLRNASKVIVVDSVRGGRDPGTVSKYTFTPRTGDLSELPSLHSLKLTDVLDLATSSGILTCPVIIVGMEPRDDSLGTGFSPEVEAALPEAIQTVMGELSR